MRLFFTLMFLPTGVTLAQSVSRIDSLPLEGLLLGKEWKWQTDNSTCLGLSLSYDIITKGHGGTLAVESAEGEGTKFIITLSYHA